MGGIRTSEGLEAASRLAGVLRVHSITMQASSVIAILISFLPMLICNVIAALCTGIVQSITLLTGRTPRAQFITDALYWILECLLGLGFCIALPLCSLLLLPFNILVVLRYNIWRRAEEATAWTLSASIGHFPQDNEQTSNLGDA